MRTDWSALAESLNLSDRVEYDYVAGRGIYRNAVVLRYLAQWRTGECYDEDCPRHRAHRLQNVASGILTMWRGQRSCCWVRYRLAQVQWA